MSAIGTYFFIKQLNKIIEEQTKPPQKRDVKLHKTENKHIYSADKSRETSDLHDYIISIAHSKPKLKKFFSKIEKYAKKVSEEEEKIYAEEMQKYSKEYVEQKEKCEEYIKALEEVGISLSTDIQGDVHYGGVKVEEGRGFNGFGEYSYGRTSFSEGFNGIRITSEMLENPDINPYENDFINWENENGDISQKIEAQEKEIASKERRLQITIFNRVEKKAEIEDMKKELDRLKTLQQEGLDKKTQMETYANLTPEQREKISVYLNQVKVCQEIGSKVKEYADKTTTISIGQDRSEIWPKALELAKEEGEISEKDIKKVNEILCEIDPQKEDYKYKEYDATIGKHGEQISSVAQWYYFDALSGIRKPTKLEEREKKLSSLEKEEKTISEAEVLIEKKESDKNMGDK